MSLNDLVDHATANLLERTGRSATWIAAAPGRVNLIGEHVDYNDGFVLPLAIDRHVVLAASPRDDRVAGFHSLSMAGDVANQQSFELRLDETIERGVPAWSNYIRGVIAGFIARGIELSGFDAVIASDVPVGGGLSSSAALEVATATVLEAMTGVSLGEVEKALLCQKAEHDFAGMPCGIMDQFASVMAKEAHLLLIDCRSMAVRHIPLGDDELAVMVIDTGVKHELTDGGYAVRRKQCEEAAHQLGVPSLRDITSGDLLKKRDLLTPVQYMRARHVVSEIARAVETSRVLEVRDYDRLGQLMAESHASLRDDYEVSCKELDVIVEAAENFRGSQPGDVIGSRMTGGGFGGSAICLIRESVAELLGVTIMGAYRRAFGKTPTFFVTRPVSGARSPK